MTGVAMHSESSVSLPDQNGINWELPTATSLGSAHKSRSMDSSGALF